MQFFQVGRLLSRDLINVDYDAPSRLHRNLLDYIVFCHPMCVILGAAVRFFFSENSNFSKFSWIPCRLHLKILLRIFAHPSGLFGLFLQIDWSFFCTLHHYSYPTALNFQVFCKSSCTFLHPYLEFCYVRGMLILTLLHGYKPSFRIML